MVTRHSLLYTALVLLPLSVSSTAFAGGQEAANSVQTSSGVSQPWIQKSKPTLAKSITLYSLYGASGVSLAVAGVFGWKSLDTKNEADTELQLGASGFCTSLVSQACSHYANLREDQNAFALRAWGLLGTSTLLGLSGLAVGKFWPNERYSATATLRPEDGGGMVTVGVRWGL